MRTLSLLLATLLIGGCTHATAGPRKARATMRVMSYNIRLDLASDGANAWPARRDLLIAVIQREAPDVLGTQEVLLHQKHDLQAALSDYDFVGVARDDGANKGEFSPLAIRRSRFAVLRSGSFWLSDVPDRPSKGWDAALPRIATWAILRDRASRRRVAVLNTHFDHVGSVARANSSTLIADWARQQVAEQRPVVVMGDLNAPPGSPPLARLTNASPGGLRLARASSMAPAYGPAGTFNAFRIDSDAREPIDHVLISDRVVVRRFATVTQHWGGRLPSDHYPVVADLELPR